MNNTMVFIANAIETNDICSTGILVVAVFSQQKLMWSWKCHQTTLLHLETAFKVKIQ